MGVWDNEFKFMYGVKIMDKIEILDIAVDKLSCRYKYKLWLTIPDAILNDDHIMSIADKILPAFCWQNGVKKDWILQIEEQENIKFLTSALEYPLDFTDNIEDDIAKIKEKIIYDYNDGQSILDGITVNDYVRLVGMKWDGELWH